MENRQICACGCGEPVSPRRQFVHGHNRRKPVTWAEVDAGYLTPCWIWDRPCGRGGRYGAIRRDWKTLSAHRFVYENYKGPIPDGLQLDHLCRVTACVNPDHLEPVTQAENIRRSNAWGGINHRKTHCSRGHTLTPDNLVQSKDGGRRCLICHNARSQRRRDRMKAARA
jgi:hypothetical protein